VRLVVGDGISETSQVETITVNAAPAAGTASSGEDGPIIWLGIVIMIVGSVGLAYSASGRMPSPAGRKPDAGSSPAPVQKTEPLPGGMTPEAIAAYTALYGTPPPSVAGGYAGALSSTAAPAEALPVPSEQMGTETCPEALLQPAAPSPQELQATLDAPAGVDDIFPLLLDPEKCIGCGTCSKACAPRAITMVDGRPALELAYCSLCGECVEGCARQAIMFNPAFKSGKSS
jgi:ferredoxin